MLYAVVHNVIYGRSVHRHKRRKQPVICRYNLNIVLFTLNFTNVKPWNAGNNLPYQLFNYVMPMYFPM